MSGLHDLRAARRGREDGSQDARPLRGKTHAQVALAWLLAQPAVCSAVIGASSIAQLEDNLGCLGWTLSEQEMNRLNTVSDSGLPYPHDFFAKYGVLR